MATREDLAKVLQPDASPQQRRVRGVFRAARAHLRDLRAAGVDDARIGELVRDALGPLRLKDVEEAQAEVVRLTKELSNSGQIQISEGGEEGEMVY